MFKCDSKIYNMVVLLNSTFWSENIHHDENHEILHVLSGHLVIECEDGRCFPVEPGETLIIPSYLNHRDVYNPNTELKLQLIHFELENPEEFFKICPPEMTIHIDEKTRNEINWILSQIRNELSSEEQDMAVNECRLNTILQLFCRAVRGTPHVTVPMRNPERLAAAAKHYVDCNFREQLNLSRIARHFRVSACHLSHLFREENGITFLAYLTNVRLKEAERLLRDSNHSVSEVAHAIGYDNANYFARIFQKRNGIPPSSYRETPFKDARREE